MGCLYTYAAPNSAGGTAPGQISSQRMRAVYGAEKLRKDSCIYGVIASPVRHSLSPQIHNRAFQFKRIGAIYLPFLVQNGQLKDFMALADALPVKGFNVTLGAAFLAHIQQVFGVPVIRHTPLTGKPVQKVAVCGGAGSFLISNAIAAGADFYITADLKYHEFFDADGRLVLADVGHYESEQFTVALLAGFLQEKFPTFAALKTGVKTNPVNYFLQ